MRNRLLVVLATTGLFATQAMAQEYSNVYVGIGLAGVDLDTDLSIGNTGQSASYDGMAPGATGFLGYTFNPFFSVEGGFTSTGREKGSSSFVADGPSPNTVSVNGETDFRSFEIAAKGTIPIGKFELFGRGGVIYGDAGYELRFTAVEDSTGISSPSKLTASFQDTSFLVGVGVGYNFGRAAIRLQYDYTTLDLKSNEDVVLTLPSGGNFVQVPTVVGIQTQDPSRILLSVSGYF